FALGLLALLAPERGQMAQPIGKLWGICAFHFFYDAQRRKIELFCLFQPPLRLEQPRQRLVTTRHFFVVVSPGALRDIEHAPQKRLGVAVPALLEVKLSQFRLAAGYFQVLLPERAFKNL